MKHIGAILLIALILSIILYVILGIKTGCWDWG